MDTKNFERLCKTGLAVTLGVCSATTGSFSVLADGDLKSWAGVAGVSAAALSMALGAGWTGARAWASRSELAVHTRHARRAELGPIRQMGVLFFGDGVSTIERMNAWHHQDRTAFSVIYTVGGRVGRRVRKLAGYFVTLRLRDSGLVQLLDGKARISDLGPSDLCARRQEPAAAIYVGAVAANGHKAKGAALQAVYDQIAKISRGKRDTRILARPVTESGMRLVRAYGFEPVCGVDEGHLGQLYEATLQSIDEAMNGPAMA